jgi:hypothetical protein
VAGVPSYEGLGDCSQFGIYHFGITHVTFSLVLPGSTMPMDCVFRGGIRGWVNVSPNQDGQTFLAPTG